LPTHNILKAYYVIQNLSNIKLYLNETIREDTYVLYGFIDR